MIEGVVVFAPTWDGASSTQQRERDIECSYRHIRAIAEDYGGDLSAPVTFAGFSAGATAALLYGMDGDTYGPDGSFDECFTGVPRPDAIIGIAGCYDFIDYGSLDDPSTTDTEIVLIAGSADSTCEAQRSRTAEAALTFEGYDVTLVEVPGAGHNDLIFLDFFGERLPLEDPAGQATMQEILGVAQPNE